MDDNLESARSILAEVFGYHDFRGGQAAAISSVNHGRDTVVLLPTGAGKSLCYQIPGLVASRGGGGGTTVVISPLIALMQDQVDSLRSRGVLAAALHSHLADFDRHQVARAFVRGELEFLYCSPERALSPSFKKQFESAEVNLLAIDEAHCVSQWGHDFRPDYFRLGEIRALTSAPTIALTATATPLVIDEICARLDLFEPAIVRGDFSRPNLQFSVEHHRGDDSRMQSLLRLLADHDMRGNRGHGRTLIYCSTRKKTETVAKKLTSAGFDAIHYHAGRTPLARERAKRAFDTHRRRILVATNAFGMGIDYPDVRVLVHFQAPGSLEAYYQEAGRAGRDGDDASCVLFFGRADLATQRRLGQGRSTQSSQARAQALRHLESYAGTEARCRQARLIEHFTGDASDYRCQCCDLCCDREQTVNAAINASTPNVIETVVLSADDKQVIITAMGRLRRPVGKRSLAKALRGSRAKSLSRGGLLQLPEWGMLKHHDEESVVGAIDELLAASVLERRGQKYPTIWLAGRAVRPKSKATERSLHRSATKDKRQRSRHTPITRALDNYRKRTARRLKWKPYMVFQKKAIAAIEEQRPTDHDALYRIPGLGPAKVERFGDDILKLVREHG